MEGTEAAAWFRVDRRRNGEYKGSMSKVMNYLTPHTDEWFNTLESCDSSQATITRQVVLLAGRSDVCSVCGDSPASDYKIIGQHFSPEIGATIRLCHDCKEIRRVTQVESYTKL